MNAMTKSKPSAPLSVADALSRPLPAGLSEAVAAVEAAQRAFEIARTAHSEALDPIIAAQLPAEARKTADALQAANVRRDLADEIGDSDAPTAEEIATLKEAADRAADRHQNHEVKKRTLAEEIERRREAMEAANAALSSRLDDWRAPIIEAADRELAEAVATINSRVATVINLQPSRFHSPALRLPSFTNPESHSGGAAMALPPAIDAALSVWARVFRIR